MVSDKETGLNETAPEQVKKPDRRRGPDLWLKSLGWLTFAGWLVMVLAMMVIEKAKPPIETIATRFFNIHLRRTWDMEVAQYLFYLMYVGLCISTIGLAINVRRLSRKTDSVRINLILLWLISLVGIITYIYFFT